MDRREQAASATATAGIAVRCTLRGGRVAAVSLVPRRPYPVEKLAVGRTPAEAAQLFANLFALCPDAHCAAASAALAAAQGLTLPPALRNWQETRRELEIVKEHGLNLLLQQPASDPMAARGLLAVHRALRAASGGTGIYWPADGAVAIDRLALRTGLEALERSLRTLCGGFWRLPEPDLAAVRHWQAGLDSPAARLLQRHARPGWAEFGRCDAALLPALPAELLAAWLADCRTELATPVWKDAARETGSYARMAETPLIGEARARYGNGLYSRTLARLAEIKALFHSVVQRSRADDARAPFQPASADGAGLAQTEASRGRLIHRAELAAGRICAYRIVAPTEWNFHPQGLVPQALTGSPATAHLPAQIEALLRAVDPCVDFNLALEHA